MKEIKQLIKSNDSILVFDIDGVLAVMEFGKRNHFISDEEWDSAIKNNINFYTDELVSKRMQQLLKEKDRNKLYVITKVNGENEKLHKENFVTKYYNILKENVYYVDEDSKKVKMLLQIKERNKEVDDEKIIMVEDTVDVLNDVLEKTNFSTAHISSFLDL